MISGIGDVFELRATDNFPVKSKEFAHKLVMLNGFNFQPFPVRNVHCIELNPIKEFFL